jgi:dienelactone hydrolase
MYHVVGEAALKRGINVITYEGPGQPTVRRYQDRGFIPDWEKVVTPVVDFALTRPEVDPKSIGLWGYSFGGYLAPRAAAFEHRLAAVLAVDGVFDFGESALRGVTGDVKKLYDSGDQQEFDKLVLEGLASTSLPTSVRWSLEQGMWSFNITSPYKFLKAAQEYNLAAVAHKIKAPVFVGDAQGDDFFPGQAKKLKSTLEAPTYHLFKSSDGAGDHCSVGASALLQQVTLDWFENVLGQK